MSYFLDAKRVGGHAFRGVMLGLIAICLYRTFVDTREFREFKAEQKRLEARVGRFEVNDPSRFAIKFVHSPGDGDWMWRFWVQANAQWIMRHHFLPGRGGSTRSMTKQTAEDLVLRCRLWRDGERWQGFLFHTNGSSSFGVPPGLGDFLNEHWGQLDVTVAGSSEQVSLGAGESVTLLSIRVPEELHAAAVAQTGAKITAEQLKQPVFTIEIEIP